jgi:hypothetical protein
MSPPFSREAFFEVFAAYNQQLWPFAGCLWVVTAYALADVVGATGPRSRFTASLLAFLWAWAAIAYHAAFFSRINPAAWIFSGLFLAEAAMLGWYGIVRDRLRFSSEVRAPMILGGGLVIYGLGYPAIAWAEGHVYPAAPTFGVPCPTTILTIGFLLMSTGNVAGLMWIPIVWAAIGGSAAFSLGVRADVMLPLAGVLGLGHALRAWSTSRERVA